MDDLLKHIHLLSPEEQLRIAETILSSLAEQTPDVVPLTKAQRKVLDQRLEQYRANPDAGSPWHEVKARILDRAKAYQE